MVTMLRRLFWLGLIGGAGYSGWMIWQQRRGSGDETAVPEWPPLDPPPLATVAAAVPTAGPVDGAAPTPVADTTGGADAVAEAGAPRWVEPVDGACPDGYPIKANDNSGIYHVPGGRFYDRTGPERCYAEAADAEADGYRAAKS